MRIWKWFKGFFSTEDKEETVENEVKLAEAQEAVEASESQLNQAKEVRQQSNQLGATARWLQREDYFAAKVRRAMEGR